MPLVAAPCSTASRSFTRPDHAVGPRRLDQRNQRERGERLGADPELGESREQVGIVDPRGAGERARGLGLFRRERGAERRDVLLVRRRIRIERANFSSASAGLANMITGLHTPSPSQKRTQCTASLHAARGLNRAYHSQPSRQGKQSTRALSITSPAKPKLTPNPVRTDKAQTNHKESGGEASRKHTQNSWDPLGVASTHR